MRAWAEFTVTGMCGGELGTGMCGTDLTVAGMCGREAFQCGFEQKERGKREA